MQPVNVAVGVLLRRDSILVCQRKRTARYALKWEFPGGKLEEGESPEEGLIRELEEELSVSAGGLNLIETQSARYSDGGIYVVSYFLVSTLDGEPKNNVFEQIRWVHPSALRSLDILEGNKSFVESFLKKWEAAIPPFVPASSHRTS